MGEYSLDQHTVALLHFNGGITDESGKVWTAVGSAATSTAKSKFGGSSLYLNGSNQYLKTPNSADFDFGTGDFTIDWWEYRTGGNSWNAILASDITTAYPSYLFGFYDTSLNSIDFLAAYNNSQSDETVRVILYKTGSIILNAWTHYAVVRKNDTFYAFQNGILVSSTTYSGALAAPTGPISIGYRRGSYFQGYIDELRVSKGIARWTSDFNPPASTNFIATAGDTKITLLWNAVTGAFGYNVKRAPTAGGPYTTIASNIAATNYEDTDVVNGTTYYYVITAIGEYGESSNSNEASATPVEEEEAVLRVTMIDSSEREYELTTGEIDGFIYWFNNHTSDDPASYMLNKSTGLRTSKEYLAFDKIISFEVTEIK